VIQALNSNRNPNKLIQLDSSHVFVPDSVVLQAFDFANE
jgi:hypothetical protein